MNSNEIKQKENQYVANTYARYDAAIVQGSGARCSDADGKTYIDFTSGIGVNSLGFCDTGWSEAVARQAAKLQHVSNLFYTEPCAQAAEKLIRLTGMKKVFFSNSGAEANEGAIKAARKYSFMKYAEEAEALGKSFNRYEIITLGDSFHGRTIATVTATGQEKFHKFFFPFLQGFSYVKANDIEDLYAKINENTCAIMAELVQGEGGVNDLEKGFVEEIKKQCAEKDILFIVDEVQTGIGRTGKLMAYEYFGFLPDIATVAKGLGGGVPIGGVLFGEKTAEVLHPGDHGSTYGGNPLVCAAADYVLSLMTKEFLADVCKKGAYFRSRLLEMEGVESVSGLGLMIGVALKEKSTADVVKACLAEGLLVLTAGKKIRLLPSLTILKEEIDEGLDIFARVILPS
ncbi:MAG: acetylornithine/succinylornithine family transaminase [Clostridiales Family XIII bacterium]|jgi:acetylornithine/N-succinyldiaminopimelate aminotransferase|nr:acetylornithine/succinylornithine family transaminase [Clostridiales Family XIII bacterium]